MRPPRPARLAALAAAALAAAALVAAALAPPAQAAEASAPVTLFSLKPDYMRVLKRRATVYMPAERGSEEGAKWARQFPGGDAERKEAAKAAKKVLELLAADAALWAGLPGALSEPAAAATPAVPAAAASNATAPAAPAAAGNATAPATPTKARRSLLRKLLAETAAAASNGTAAGDPAFSSFLEKIGANAAKPAAAAAKPAATTNVVVVPANPNAEPAIDAAAAETDPAAAKAATAQAAAEADAVEAAATQAVKAEADKAAADKAAANKGKKPAVADNKGPAAAAAAAKPAAEEKKDGDKPAANNKAAAAAEEEELAPKIGGLYAGPNIVDGFAVAQSYAALDAYEAANAKGALGTGDPPSPALAVGHGQVLEAAGWSLRAYSALDGTPLIAPTSLATLFDVAQPVADSSSADDAAKKTASLIGRASAHFDAHGTGRFFVAAHVQDVAPTAEPKSRIVVAVSAGPNIVGSWYIYDLDVGFSGKGSLPAREACTGKAGMAGAGGKPPADSQAQCWAAEPALGNDGQALYLTFDNYRRDPESGYTHIGEGGRRKGGGVAQLLPAGRLRGGGGGFPPDRRPRRNNPTEKSQLSLSLSL